MSKISATFPAGQYYIGDACYVMHDKWSELCNEFFFADRKDNGCNEGEFNMKDNIGKIFVGNTAYGDGYYKDNFGNGYGVDAGNIALIPLECIDQTDKENEIRYGVVVTFAVDFEVSVKNGVFKFGNIVIDTANETGYEDDEELSVSNNPDDWDCDPMDESETW